MSAAELACTYAVLICHDTETEVTGENIKKILDAAGVTVEPYWPSLFAKMASKQDIAALIASTGSGGGGGGGGGGGEVAAAAAGGAAAGGDAPAAKAKEPEPEEEEEDMGFDLFD